MNFRASICVLLLTMATGCNGAAAVDDDLSAYYGFKEMEPIKLEWGIGGLSTADFNGDGRLDMVVADNAKARIDVLIQRAKMAPMEDSVVVDANDMDINAIQWMSRFSREDVAVSQKMANLACGDLNGDGLVDLAFYGEPKGLYVILQKKEAGSDKPVWRTPHRIDIQDGLPTPNALVCTDINNDGAKDLVLAGREGIYVVLQDDKGGLDEPVQYPTTATTLGIEAADLNGDGVTDLVMVTNDGEKPLHVRFGLKSGQLGPEVRYFIEKPAALVTSNIDGRPGDEVLVVDAVSGRLLCYEFAKGQAGDDWPVVVYPLETGEGGSKRDLVIADVTGDGLDDVVVSDPGAAELMLYQQAKGAGLGEPVKFPSLSEITSIAAADVTGDGKAEVVVLSVKEKAIGISGFEDERLAFPKLLDVSGEPQAMDLADIDGDGKVDCVYVAKEEGDKRYLRAVPDVGSKDRKADAGQAINVELTGLGASPQGMKVVDADQDGLADVLIFVSYESPILVHQVEKGKFEVVDAAQSRSSLLKEAQLRTVVSADVDGKAGRELLVAQKNFARSLVLKDGKTWTVVDQYNAKSTENQLSSVAALQMKGQDRPVIALLDGQKGELQILAAGEDNTYRLSEEIDVGKWSGSTHLKVLSGKLTGDSSQSILLFDGSKFAIVSRPGEGAGWGTLDKRFSYETKLKDGAYANLVAGDINSDGRVDLVMLEFRRSYIEILALGSDGMPKPAMRFKVFEQKSYSESKGPAKVGVEPREFAIADVTGDGKNDLIIVVHDRIIVYPQD